MTSVRFPADECCPVALVFELRAHGLDVRYVAEHAAGLLDDDVLELANRAQRILVTTDKDFGALVVRLGHSAPGIVLIRVSGLGRRSVAHEIGTMIASIVERLPDHISTVTTGRVRRRPISDV